MTSPFKAAKPIPCYLYRKIIKSPCSIKLQRRRISRFHSAWTTQSAAI